MNKISTLMLVGLLVAGCSSGGGDDKPSNGGGGGGGGGGGLTVNSAPTAALSGSQSNAAALAAEIQKDVPDLVSLASAKPPGAINTLPGGVLTTLQCSSLGQSGSGTYSVDSNIGSGGPTTGSTITITYGNCTFTSSGSTSTINGSMTLTYTRYNSAQDFAISTKYTNLTMAFTSPSGNYTYGPMNGTYTIDFANGTYSYSSTMANGGASNISSSNIVTSGSSITITSATYVYNSTSASGVIKVVFNNWRYDSTTGRAVSGSITVTGANGNTVKIDATGTGYTVTYTVNGAVTAYTVAF